MIGIFVQVVAVGVFGIPTAILGDGFQEAVAGYQEGKQTQRKEEAAELIAINQAKILEEREKTPIQDADHKINLWNFLHAKTDNGKFFEIAMNCMIMLSVFAFLLETCTIITDNETADRFLDVIEV